MKLGTSLNKTFDGADLRDVAGKWFFREVDVAGETTDSFDRLKLLFKMFPRFYYFLIHVVSPVCSDRRPLKRFLESAEGLVLNIGSGIFARKMEVVNADITH